MTTDNDVFLQLTWTRDEIRDCFNGIADSGIIGTDYIPDMTDEEMATLKRRIEDNMEYMVSGAWDLISNHMARIIEERTP